MDAVTRNQIDGYLRQINAMIEGNAVLAGRLQSIRDSLERSLNDGVWESADPDVLEAIGEVIRELEILLEPATRLAWEAIGRRGVYGQ